MKGVGNECGLMEVDETGVLGIVLGIAFSFEPELVLADLDGCLGHRRFVA